MRSSTNLNLRFLIMTKPGWWAAHEYSRRSVKNEVKHFCGYPALKELMLKSDDFETESLIPCLFCTGGRVTELLELKRSQFSIDGDMVKVSSMPVEKLRTRKRVGTQPDGTPIYHYEKKIDYRTFSWPISEPLTTELFDFIYTKGTDEKLYSRSASWIYKRILSLDKGWWPHRFRSCRASQLASAYGFNDLMLMQWFGWATDDEAKRYAKLSNENLEVWMRSHLRTSQR